MRNLDNKELQHFYCSCNTIRVMKLRMRQVGHETHMGKLEIHTEFVSKPQRKRQFEKPRHGLKYIKMGLKRNVKSVCCIQLAQHRAH